MTSAINYSAIITTFPVAGKDNDSQGFRDNFSATSLGLSVAKQEITALQTNVVLKADLATGTEPVDNDMLGSIISNGLYKQFNGFYFNAGTLPPGSQDINLDSGPIQRITISGNATLRFTNWPDAGSHSTIRLMIIGNQQNSYTVNFTTENSGIVWKAAGFSGSITVGANNQYQLIEAFTYDKGTNIFMNKLAVYSSN
jgi:hypothetical protein